MPRRWRQVAAAAAGILVMAGLQAMISSTPTALVSTSGPRDAGYRLDRDERGRYVLTLYGDAARVPAADLSMLRIGAAASADPVQAPQPRLALDDRPRRRATLLIDADPGTYKLRLPGFRPFGPVNARG